MIDASNASPARHGRPRVLVARLDNDGDVLLAGPAVRAVAAGASRVTLLCGPRGRQAAQRLPGVDRVRVFAAGWIDADCPPVDRDAVHSLVDGIAADEIDEAVVLTSFHQSPLPTAMVLRMAGVPRVAAISTDFPGSLLDVRHRVDDDVHEVERGLSLVAALGYRLPGDDDARLRIASELTAPASDARTVVLHPGARASARAWSPAGYRVVAVLLRDAGWHVAVTGDAGDAELTAGITDGLGAGVSDLGGRTTYDGLAGVLRHADALVAGNTGTAHLAAAVGTPVVSLFAPTVPAVAWRPWGVAHELLGDQSIACAGCRATRCPQPGHPCLDDVTADDVVAAVRRLLADRDRTLQPMVGAQP